MAWLQIRQQVIVPGDPQSTPFADCVTLLHIVPGFIALKSTPSGAVGDWRWGAFVLLLLPGVLRPSQLSHLGRAVVSVSPCQRCILITVDWCWRGIVSHCSQWLDLPDREYRVAELVCCKHRRGKWRRQTVSVSESNSEETLWWVTMVRGSLYWLSSLWNGLWSWISVCCINYCN